MCWFGFSFVSLVVSDYPAMLVAENLFILVKGKLIIPQSYKVMLVKK